MRKNNVIIEIAELSLNVKNPGIIFNPPLLESFVDKNKKSKDKIWRMQKMPSGRYAGRTPFPGSKLVSYTYSQILAMNSGMLLHATAVIKGINAFLFLGVGGSGKSTIAAISKKHKVLGDDIIALRKKDGRYYAFSTPWAQGAFIKPDRRLNGKIAAVFFIKKSDRISFDPIEPEEALARILSNHIHFLVYTARPLLKSIFTTAHDFVKSIPAYEMEFEKDRDFWSELEKNTDVSGA